METEGIGPVNSLHAIVPTKALGYLEVVFPCSTKNHNALGKSLGHETMSSPGLENGHIDFPLTQGAWPVEPNLYRMMKP